MGEAVSFRIMERLSTDHLKECMEPTMEKTSNRLNYIYPIIEKEHPTLYEFLERYVWKKKMQGSKRKIQNFV